jgi:transcriptional regulator GlxA family with amidase domain
VTAAAALSRRHLLGAAALGLGGIGLGSPPAEASHPFAASGVAGAPDEKLDIAIVLLDGFTGIDAVAPYEVFSRIPGATVRYIGQAVAPVETDTRALTALADGTWSDAPRPDVVLVPGGGMRYLMGAAGNPELLGWLTDVHATTRFTTSVCTGSLILGAAGLLEGKDATTYWSSRNMLKHFGATYRHKRYVVEGRIITGAGVTAAIDTSLIIASRLVGDDVASALQLALEYDPQPPYDTGDYSRASGRTRSLAEKLVADADQP